MDASTAFCNKKCGRLANRPFPTCCQGCPSHTPACQERLESGLCSQGCGRARHVKFPTCCQACAKPGCSIHTPECGQRQRAPPSALFLPREHVLGSQLSDHLPQVFTCGGSNGKVQVLTWNIMTKCRCAGFTNNGFAKNETDEEYARRLQAVAQEVARFFVQNRSGLPLIAALQECPLKPRVQEHLTRGIQHFHPGVAWVTMQTGGSFSNITLWDAATWQLEASVQGSGMLSRALSTRLAPAPGMGCTTCTLLNVHLEWKADPDPENDAYCKHAREVGKTIGQCLLEKGLVVVTGDFNMNVAHAVEALAECCSGSVVDQISDSSQAWNKAEGAPLMANVDGLIWSDTS
mmetsp:Transcript_5494/g.10484  ORF Transcript_5494/g.10484 Transcript_5494/m.10484 type:complete len:348 (+) Transcript_5494:85-1128(+)